MLEGGGSVRHRAVQGRRRRAAAVGVKTEPAHSVRGHCRVAVAGVPSSHAGHCRVAPALGVETQPAHTRKSMQQHGAAAVWCCRRRQCGVQGVAVLQRVENINTGQGSQMAPAHTSSPGLARRWGHTALGVLKVHHGVHRYQLMAGSPKCCGPVSNYTNMCGVCREGGRTTCSVPPKLHHAP